MEHEQRVVFERLEATNRPAPFKYYPDLPLRLLEPELLPSTVPAVDVLAGAGGAPGQLDWPLLGTLCFLAGGVTRTRRLGDHRVWYRTAMSAGNLHPVEIYLRYQGCWHYQPLEHGLVPVRPPSGAADPEGSAVFVLTGIPFRTGWKYGERGWRHLFWDAGTVAANLMAAASAHGLATRLVVGFDDHAVSKLLGLDVLDELPLAMVVVEGAGGFPDLPGIDAIEHLEARTTPVAPHPVRFPLVEAAHAAGVLSAADVAPWRDAAVASSISPLPASGETPASDLTVEEVILRRGSTRAFRRERAPSQLLDWALPVAARPVRSDFSGDGTLLTHLVAVHDVEGSQPYASSVEEARATSTALCLGQSLGGTSAYTVFHCADLDALFRTLGGRGYRAAQLEAGVVAQRLALGAVALGCGATGLTFLDGMVSGHFESSASPMLATAVGLPTHPPVAGGAPGKPVELRPRG